MDQDEKRRRRDDERRELAATVLADAVFDTDERVAKKYDIGLRTLRRFRQELATDPLLKGMLAAKMAALERGWVSEMPLALREGLETQRTIARNLRDDPDFKANPGALREVAQANIQLADIYFTWLSIHATGDAQNQAGEKPGEVRGDGDATDRVC